MSSDGIQINNSYDFINVIMTDEPRACVDYRIRIRIILFLELSLQLYIYSHMPIFTSKHRYSSQ